MFLKFINKFLDTPKISDIRFYKGKGCKACNDSGYSGRVGIFEVLEINDNIKELILARADNEQIKKKAIENGMTTMFEDGFNKAVAGKTTLEEIFRVTKQ